LQYSSSDEIERGRRKLMEILKKKNNALYKIGVNKPVDFYCRMDAERQT
jgi:hypothetical protein